MPDVIHICYPGVGGQAAVALGLAIEGQRAGVSHAVVFYGVEATAQQHLDTCQREKIECVSILKSPGVAFRARKKLSHAIARMKPRMVVSHHHDTAVTVAGTKACRGVHRVFVEHHSNALKTTKDWILSTLAHRLSDHTVYLTNEYRDEVRAKMRRLFVPEKTKVIANGLDLARYYPSGARNTQKTVVGMQGRMDRGKDFASLLRAFAELPATESMVLELVGDGPDRPLLQRLADDLGVGGKVVFTGFLSREELVGRMRGWRIAVLATMGETLSMAILEAWALGLPLVSTRVPGVAGLVTHGGDGLLVDYFDHRALASALRQLIDDPETARKLGQAGMGKVRREFDLKKNGRRYLGLCGEISSPAPDCRLEPGTVS